MQPDLELVSLCTPLILVHKENSCTSLSTCEMHLCLSGSLGTSVRTSENEVSNDAYKQKSCKQARPHYMP